MRLCSIEGCDGATIAKGLCKKHYQRLKRHGDPMVSILFRGEGSNTEDRFRSRVGDKNESGCMEWKQRRNKLGYGTCNLLGENIAHRVAWRISNKSEIPKGLIILHKCDNPSCCNPKHLVLGSSMDNAIDRDIKGRGVYFKGEFNGNSKLKNEDIPVIKNMLVNKESNYNDIGKIYGVSRYTIGRIKRGESWA